jgi:hypothetical protein
MSRTHKTLNIQGAVTGVVVSECAGFWPFRKKVNMLAFHTY